MLAKDTQTKKKNKKLLTFVPQDIYVIKASLSQIFEVSTIRLNSLRNKGIFLKNYFKNVETEQLMQNSWNNQRAQILNMHRKRQQLRSENFNYGYKRIQYSQSSFKQLKLKLEIKQMNKYYNTYPKFRSFFLSHYYEILLDDFLYSSINCIINKYMFKHLLIILILLYYSKSERQYFYLYNEDKQLEGIEFNTEGIPLIKLNCAIKKCTQIQPDSFPSIFSWDGPGTSYRNVQPPTIDGIRQSIKKWNQHPLHFLRVFIDQTPFIPLYLISTVVCAFLYLVFTALFTAKAFKLKVKQQ